ncbi:hypothetical protein QOT17_011171 [Balamuthia mandrillaris]
MEVDKKAKKLAEKTEEARRLFNLPNSEEVIQDYTCTMSRTIRVGGRLYITQNYVCWTAVVSLTSATEKIPFREIKKITPQKTLLVPSAIEIQTAKAQYFFSAFMHRDEALNLMLYLWQNPPSVVSLSAAASSSSSSSSSSAVSGTSRSGSFSTTGTAGFGARPSSSPSLAASDGGASSRPTSTPHPLNRAPLKWGSSADIQQISSSPSLGHQQQAQITNRNLVDTAASKRALKAALEARDLGQDTLQELSIQAEQIDRIENDIEKVHGNLDKGERLMRGIESLGGYVLNNVTNPVSSAKGTNFTDRTLHVAKRTKVVTLEILIKHKNDHLAPATLQFEEDIFRCLENGEQIRGMQWRYDSVDRVVVRSRPLHLDIRFLKQDRFRICSSYLQAIVNEMYLRVATCQVVFEAGAKSFDYGDPSLVIATKKSRDDGGGGSAFFGVRKQAPDLVSDNVSQEVKQALQEQQDDLDQIEMLVGEMGGMGVTISTELDRQNQQLDRVTGRVISANERLHNNTNRIEKML